MDILFYIINLMLIALSTYIKIHVSVPQTHFIQFLMGTRSEKQDKHLFVDQYLFAYLFTSSRCIEKHQTKDCTPLLMSL